MLIIKILLIAFFMVQIGCSKTTVMVHCDEVHIHAEVNSDTSTRSMDYSGVCKEIQ